MPAVVENFFETIIGCVDRYFVSKTGVAGNVRISNYVVAKQPVKARHIAQQSIILAILFGIATGIITLFFAEPLLKLMGIEANVLEAGKFYFKIVAIPSIFMSLMFV